MARGREEFLLGCPNCGGDIHRRVDDRQEPAHFEPEVRKRKIGPSKKEVSWSKECKAAEGRRKSGRARQAREGLAVAVDGARASRGECGVEPRLCPSCFSSRNAEERKVVFFGHTVGIMAARGPSRWRRWCITAAELLAAIAAAAHEPTVMPVAFLKTPEFEEPTAAATSGDDNVVYRLMHRLIPEAGRRPPNWL